MSKPASALPISSVLDEEIIRSELGETSQALLREVQVLEEVDSTNLALQQLPRDSQHASALIADRQTAGRGRRGRSWHSPSGCNIYLSLGWRFTVPAAQLTQLPLAVAVASARALRRAGVNDCKIKWPNDLFVDGKKLAGILVELQGSVDREVLAVIGVGVNLGMSEDLDTQAVINQAWTEMSAHIVGPIASTLRSRVCGLLLDELLEAVKAFSESGFKSFVPDWSDLDLLRGKDVRLDTGNEIIDGVAMGVSERGGLLLACISPSGMGDVREFLAGDASVRLAPS